MRLLGRRPAKLLSQQLSPLPQAPGRSARPTVSPTTSTMPDPHPEWHAQRRRGVSVCRRLVGVGAQARARRYQALDSAPNLVGCPPRTHHHGAIQLDARAVESVALLHSATRPQAPMLVKRGGGYVILGTVKILGADELKVSADCHLAATWHLLSTCRPMRADPHRFGPGAAQVPAALAGPGNKGGSAQPPIVHLNLDAAA